MTELIDLIKRLRNDGSILMGTRTVKIQKASATEPDIRISYDFSLTHGQARAIVLH